MTAAMIEVGNGTHALIGIHGWFEGRKQWSSIAPYLDTKIFTHYFPSLRGDDVKKHERGGRTHRDVSDDIAALAASRGLTPTPRGAQLCDWSARTLQLLADSELRHIQVWFNTDNGPTRELPAVERDSRRTTPGHHEKLSSGVHFNQPIRPVRL
jgi:hypothetical protein